MDITKHRLHNQRLVGAKSVATVAPLTGRCNGRLAVTLLAAAETEDQGLAFPDSPPDG